MPRALRSGRSSAVAVATAPVRVAIYARVSTDERLGQSFNSIHLQREACESYVNIHRAEGWSVVAAEYSDGGFTGANVTRPALQRLIADVEAGKIDVVLTYKLDRLSRSMRDFLNLLHFFDQHHVSFVSVSQSFDTTTPIGKMTLNLLASFGEFERQVTAARTKDKLGAARRRGKYVGGGLVLGYDRAPEGARLVVNEPEAAVVREIYHLFVEKRSLVATLDEVHRRGWTLKKWVTKTGRTYGGSRFDKDTLRRLLTNHIYIGKVFFEGEIYDGEHTGIVPAALFKEVQKVLVDNRRDTGAARPNAHGALLKGLIHCASCDRMMSHQWTRSQHRLHRYYVCQKALKEGRAACPTKSVPALAVEQFVIDRVRGIGRDPELRKATFEQALAQVARERKSLRAEAKRLERERTRAKQHIDRLVASVAAAEGRALEALMEALSKAQADGGAVAARLTETEGRIHALDAHHLDEADLSRALDAFDGVWEALLVPERVRVLNLLIERVTYDGVTEQLTITYSPTGIATLAAEVSS